MRRLPLLLLGVALTACATSTPDPGLAPPSSTDPLSTPLPSSSPPAPTTTPPPDFAASVSPIGPRLAQRMRHTHSSGCPVPLAELRHLQISYVGFDGADHVGEMVVHRDHAADVVHVFEALHEARWPIRRMELVDRYAGDDDRSMAANNTSAYNCRRVAGSDRWSEHSYGAAIDINPVQNPYVRGTYVAPPAGATFATISRLPRASVPLGVIRESDVVVEAFSQISWTWGGHWQSSKDYQHFSASGD